MLDTSTIADELTLDEQIERAEFDLECALTNLNELIEKKNRLVFAKTDRAIDAIINSEWDEAMKANPRGPELTYQE